MSRRRVPLPEDTTSSERPLSLINPTSFDKPAAGHSVISFAQMAAAFLNPHAWPIPCRTRFGTYLRSFLQRGLRGKFEQTAFVRSARGVWWVTRHGRDMRMGRHWRGSGKQCERFIRFRSERIEM